MKLIYSLVPYIILILNGGSHAGLRDQTPAQANNEILIRQGLIYIMNAPIDGDKAPKGSKEDPPPESSKCKQQCVAKWNIDFMACTILPPLELLICQNTAKHNKDKCIANCK